MIERAGRPRTGLSIAAAMLLALASAAAAAPQGESENAAVILERMEKAAAPKEKMRADLKLTMVNENGEPVSWSGDLYWRGEQGDSRGVRRLVLDSPQDVAGVEYVIERTGPDGDRVSMYLPMLDRTRVVRTELRGESFLGTDFNFEDLGYDSLEGQKHEVLGTNTVDGKRCTQVRSTTNDAFGYGHVVRCIDEKTHLPIRTEYHDRAGKLWKVRTIEVGKAKSGETLPTRIVMEDVQAETRSTIELSNVRLDESLSDEAFSIRGTRAGAAKPGR
jgi:outer membrane lipoprotein-sorting protein